MKLQLALDGTLDAALRLLEQTHRCIDIIEIGTPLIFREGIAAVRQVRAAYPNLPILADLKIMDAGDEEATIAFEAGASYVTVLALAAESTIRGAVAAARRAGGQVVADLVQVGDPVGRGRDLLAWGCDVLCVHTAYDMQGQGHTPLAALQTLRAHLPDAPLAVAGGVSLATIGDLLEYHPSIIVVGGAITRSEDAAHAAFAFHERIGQR